MTGRLVAYFEETSMSYEITKAFIIECRTGCSCCSGENHYRGPFKTREEAERKIANYKERRLLSSQYSERGNYSIEESDAEILPDGRIIIDDFVCAGFAEDNPDGDDYYKSSY
jgi:hypothetical protein